MENTHIEVGSLVKHKHYGFEGEVIGHHHGQVIIEITEGEAPCTEEDGTYIACVQNVEVIGFVEEVEVPVYAVEMEMEGMTTRFATVEDYMEFMVFMKEVLAQEGAMKLITVAGMIGVGKSSLTELIAERYNSLAKYEDIEQPVIHEWLSKWYMNTEEERTAQRVPIFTQMAFPSKPYEQLT